MKFQIIIISVFILVGKVLSQPDTSNEIAHQIIYKTYNCQFEKAINQVDSLLQLSPSSIEYNYFRGMIFYRHWLYKEQFKRNAEDKEKSNELLNSFFETFQATSQICDSILKLNPDDERALFYGGAAYGFIGIYYARAEELYTAASEGKKGLEYHERLKNKKPDWIDAYLSEAIFNFHASQVPWYLEAILWILGRSGDEEKALEILELLSEQGNYSRYEAQELLLSLYIRRHELKATERLYSEIEKELPGMKYYLTTNLIWDCWRNKEEKFAAELVSEKLEKSKWTDVEQHRKELGVIYILLANTYWKLNENQRAIIYWEKVVNENCLPEESGWLKLVLANSYKNAGKEDEAIQLYEEIIRSSPNGSTKEKAEEAIQKIKEKI